MIKYLSEGGSTKLEVHGSLNEIASECIYMVHLIYERMPEKIAEQFKYGMTETFSRGIPFLDKRELAKEAIECAKDLAGDKKDDDNHGELSEEEADDILNKLAELGGKIEKAGEIAEALKKAVDMMKDNDGEDDKQC